MDYDIALKEMLRLCSREILRRWLNIPVAKSAVIEDLPQETTSLRRSDLPLRVITEDGDELLVLIEIETRWRKETPLRMLEYLCRHKLKLGKIDVPTHSVVFLLTFSSQASDYYEDDQVRFRYRLIRVYEMDAADIVQEGLTCMAPLVPIMQNGEQWFNQADELIYKSDLPTETKADMYTAMSIISGLTSKSLLQRLLLRRREIMIESAFFEILREEIEKEVKEETWREAWEGGMQQGMQQGFEKGHDEGWREGLRDGLLQAIALGLDLKFGVEGLKLMPEIERIDDLGVLRALREALRSAESLDELRSLYQ